MGFHEANLHGAGLSTQKNAVIIGEIEGVAPIPGGVTLFNIQPGEIVVCQLHLRAVYHLVAQTDKNIFDLLEYLIHGVLMADGDLLAGNGYIDGLGGQLGLQNRRVDVRLPAFQLFLDLGPDGVGQLSHDRPLLSGKLAHLLENGSQFSLLAQQLDPQFLQSGRGRRAVQCFQRTEADLFQLFFHNASS